MEAGLDGLGLTRTHALRRAVVREAAERWPGWWRQELFAPPHREKEGGFMGFHAERVSEGAQRMRDELARVLSAS